ncbi:hypothetical protein ACJJTC_012510 [Scirpophaga incertulas]
MNERKEDALATEDFVANVMCRPRCSTNQLAGRYVTARKFEATLVIGCVVTQLLVARRYWRVAFAEIPRIIESRRMLGKGQDSSDSRSRRSSATWWRRAAAIQGGTALALSVNHQSFTPPFETAVKRQTYEPLFISFQKYNRIDDRDGGDNHQSVTADRTSVVCEAARDKVGALL